MSVSIVVPVFNELENVRPFWTNLSLALQAWGRPYEILFVDDGSRDGTVAELKEIAEADPRVKLVLFRRNYGQTAAMAAGIRHATMDVVVTMDGDQQNDPGDIPMMVEKLEEGFDLVHGWRRKRQDTFINRRLPSVIANWLISRVTRFPIHDLGCTLKAMRREIAQELELYGEMHRFIPILAHQRGARCVEVETRHHPRRLGQTKYGIGRTFRVVLDLLTVKYLIHFSPSPMKFFGRFGLLCWGAAALALLGSVAGRVFASQPLGTSPLWLLGLAAGIAGLQCFGMGLLGEVQTRLRHADPEHPSYTVRELVNFQQPTLRIATSTTRAA